MIAERRWIDVGSVCGVFGVRGWIKVLSSTQPRENILSYSPWHLQLDGERAAFDVERGQQRGKVLITQLAGIDSREEAARLCGVVISISREQLPPLPAGEYYWSDLIGLRVQGCCGCNLGRVESVLETGANDVLVVRGERERLIPFVLKDVVEHVDLAAGTIQVNWDPDF
jgi:16S rRNA processing protein RimM